MNWEITQHRRVRVRDELRKWQEYCSVSQEKKKIKETDLGQMGRSKRILGRSEYNTVRWIQSAVKIPTTTINTCSRRI
jgi:hypothetical protein